MAQVGRCFVSLLSSLCFCRAALQIAQQEGQKRAHFLRSVHAMFMVVHGKRSSSFVAPTHCTSPVLFHSGPQVFGGGQPAAPGRAVQGRAAGGTLWGRARGASPHCRLACWCMGRSAGTPLHVPLYPPPGRRAHGGCLQQLQLPPASAHRSRPRRRSPSVAVVQIALGHEVTLYLIGQLSGGCSRPSGCCGLQRVEWALPLPSLPCCASRIVGRAARTTGKPRAWLRQQRAAGGAGWPLWCSALPAARLAAGLLPHFLRLPSLFFPPVFQTLQRCGTSGTCSGRSAASGL